MKLEGKIKPVGNSLAIVIKKTQLMRHNYSMEVGDIVKVMMKKKAFIVKLINIGGNIGFTLPKYVRNEVELKRNEEVKYNIEKTSSEILKKTNCNLTEKELQYLNSPHVFNESQRREIREGVEKKTEYMKKIIKKLKEIT